MNTRQYMLALVVLLLLQAPGSSRAGLIPSTSDVLSLDSTAATTATVEAAEPVATPPPAEAPAEDPEALLKRLSVSVKGHFDNDADKLPLNRTVHYYIDVTWHGKLDDPPDVQVQTPPLNGLELVNQSDKVEMLPEDDWFHRRFTYVLKPAGEEGDEASVGPTKVEYSIKGLDEPLSARTGSSPITIAAAAINWLKVAIWGILGLAIIIIAGIAVALVRWTMFGSPTDDDDDATVSAEERFRSELIVLESRIIEGDSAEGCDKAAKWTKNLLAALAEPSIRRATHSELVERFANSDALDSQLTDRALSILERCEQVKFAGHRPTRGEQQDLYRDCQSLLEQAMAAVEQRPANPTPDL
ncbi:hypothetical protein ACFL34_05060 [Candidatus Sumerlaeota bacterium]